MSQASLFGVHRLCFTKCAAEIRRGVEVIVGTYEAKIDAIVDTSAAWLAKDAPSVPPRQKFSATFGRLATADGHAALASAELTLPALVSGDEATRAASSDAKKKLQHMWARAYARPDVYKCLVEAQGTAQNDEEIRLVTQILKKFRQAGAGLPTADAREEVSKLDARCSALAFEIEQNINEDCTEVSLMEEELDGCGKDFVNALPKSLEETSGRTIRRCSVKAPVLVPIMKRATIGETRRKMLEASQKRCMEKNTPLLDELFQQRHAAAQQLGYASHAERMLSKQMAQTPKQAEEFCSGMLEKIQLLRDTEMERLLNRKQTDQARRPSSGEPDAKRIREGGTLQAWDVSFYSDLLKQEELSFDDEKVKEFFPLVGTIDRVLSVYAEMLGLSFERKPSLPRWHEEVVAFEVRRDGTLVGHLYLDQFPRDGKFGHQMIVPLAPSFVDDETGGRCIPACVNISNLPRPQGGKPALLRWAEMQTLFHELGHAMHCLCTTTQYSLLSWAWPMVPWPGGVEQDFLEVPSMALEKFACEPALLARVAQHYSGEADAPKLSEDTIETIKALEKWMIGVTKSKYFAMALFDLKVHSQAPPYTFDGESGLSAQELFARMLEKYTGLQELPGTYHCASWYHLVIGYDAGYYGYGWSDVYAADVFGAMLSSKKGLLSAETGGRLRDEILGPCATKSGGEMLRGFLGREPSTDAWLHRLGIAVR